MSSYVCPRCRAVLSPKRHERGVSFSCDACGGIALNLSMIRQHAGDGLSKQVFRELRASSRTSQLACPACQRPLAVFDVRGPRGDVELDGCPTCSFFWFDATELERLGIVLKGQPPQEVRRAIANLKLEALHERAKGEREPMGLLETLLDTLFWFV